MSVHHLIYQPFLNGREQLRKTEVKESQFEYIKNVSSDQE